MRAILFAAVAAVAAPAGVSAAVTIVGAGNAAACSRAAVGTIDARPGGAYCDAALKEDNLSARDRAATLVNRGIVRLRTRDRRSAMADFDQAAALEPSLGEAYANKAILLLNEGEAESAATLFTRAIDLGTEKPEIAYYGRGVANEQLGRIAAAYGDYSMAARLKPRWAEPRLELTRFKVLRNG